METAAPPPSRVVAPRLRGYSVMSPDARKPKPVPPDATEGERVSRHSEEGTLGYADSAGHPGGEADLDGKTESEDEHEESA